MKLLLTPGGVKNGSIREAPVGLLSRKAPSGDDTTLGIVDFTICPHLPYEGHWRLFTPAAHGQT